MSLFRHPAPRIPDFEPPALPAPAGPSVVDRGFSAGLDAGRGVLAVVAFLIAFGLSLVGVALRLAWFIVRLVLTVAFFPFIVMFAYLNGTRLQLEINL